MRKTSFLISCISISMVLLVTNLQALAQSSTTTTITSSTNPSITGNNVLFTATVTASGNPVTVGTVTFKEGATILVANVALNAGGLASFNTSALSEGNHIITADYNGSANFNLSNGSINQRVNNPTVVNGSQFCNSASGITFRDNNTATPYPSNITVSGLSGTITKLTVSLNGFSTGSAEDVDLLLVGPAGQKFILLSDVGGTNIASNINLTLDDAAANILPTTALSSGTFRPADYAIGNADNFFAPAPAGPYNSAAPNGGATFASIFNGANPNGTWSLYAIDDLTGNTNGSISGGWCLTFGDNSPCPQFAAVSQPAFTICGTDSTSDISLTATENNVNVKLVYFTSPTATPYATPGSELLATALTPAGGAAPYTVNFDNLKFPVNATNAQVIYYVYALLDTNDPDLTNSNCRPYLQFTVTSDPAAIIDAGPDQFICATDTIQFNATLSGLATNMVWQKNVAFGVFIGPDTETNARFVLNANGRSQPFIKFGAMTNDPSGVCQGGLDTVIIYISPAAIADAGVDIRICQSNAEKDGIELNGQISEQATTARWSGGNGQFSPDANTLNAVYHPTADEITTGSVTLYLTTNDPDGICGPGVDSVKITIDPAAIIDAGPDQFICATDTIQFNATLSGLATNMVWQKNVAYGVFIGPDTETNARFVLNANGRSQPFIKFGAMTNDPSGVCQGGLDTVIIYISPAAIADAGVDIRICQSNAEKDGIQLNGQISEQATTARWSGGNGQFSPDANKLNAVYHPTANEITAGSVTLYLTTNDPDGLCGPGVDSVKIRIDPSAIINAGPDQFICNGDIIYLKATLSGVATNMVWQKNAAYGVFLDPDTNPETRFQLNDAGKALDFIKFGAMTNDPGDNVCEGGLDTVTIFLNKLPAVTIEGTAGSVCPSSSNDYTAPPNMSKYEWEIISGSANIVSGEEDDRVATVIAGTTCHSTYVLKLTVTDANGCSNTLIKEVTINDTESPVITTQFLNKTSLWPPNHKMVDITLTPATDNCEVKLTNISITSNEPVNDIGDGSTQVDWEIVDATHIRLRAERSGVFNVNANDFGRVYTINYTATDACGNTSTGTNTVIVGHNIIAPKPGANAFKIGTTVSLAGTFWDIPGKKHTAKWIIDQTSVTGIVTAEPSGNKTGKVSGSFKPTSAGIYKLRLNITDQNNVTSYATNSGASEAFLVAYDPKGGYTYGAAQFISPKGALSSNPNSSGKVSFGFTSNYFKNATNPKGETAFEFKIQDFEFAALNFDYLVITGAKGQFKGLGKVIRSGVEQSGYAFIMTVIDGQLPGGGGFDKIRLKIYHKNTGAVIYDNQKGASDNADPTTTIDAPKADGTDIVIVNIPTATSQSLKSAPNTTVEAESSIRVNVLPNPTESVFTLNVSSKNLSDLITIRLMNINGQLIRVIKGKPGESFRFGTELAKGVYIAEVRQGNEKKIVKLIKF